MYNRFNKSKKFREVDSFVQDIEKDRQRYIRKGNISLAFAATVVRNLSETHRQATIMRLSRQRKSPNEFEWIKASVRGASLLLSIPLESIGSAYHALLSRNAKQPSIKPHHSSNKKS
jgi:hypothetical protein